MSVLEEIVAHKRVELAEAKARLPLEKLMRQLSPETPASFSSVLTRTGVNIIAEIKYRSPTHGPFSCQLPFAELADLYAENGAAAVSVVTEQEYFSGELEYLKEIHREHPDLPLLRKDFIVDPYQVVESRINGASAYLLIVSCLSDGELRGLISRGVDLEFDPLVEVHDIAELERAVEGGARIIGVNNRDLRTFSVNLDISFDIAKRMEGVEGFLLISESGISEISQIRELRDAGFSGFLVGSTLMEADDPARTLRELRGEG